MGQLVGLESVVEAQIANEQVGAANLGDAWQIDGQTHLLRITEAVMRAIGVEPDADGAAHYARIFETELLGY